MKHCDCCTCYDCYEKPLREKVKEIKKLIDDEWIGKVVSIGDTPLGILRRLGNLSYSFSVDEVSIEVEYVLKPKDKLLEMLK